MTSVTALAYGSRMHRLAALVVALFAVAACAAPGPTPIVNPPAEPIVDCRAPQQTCASALADAGLNAPPGTVVVRLQVVCTNACAVQAGEANVAIQYSDGSTSTYTTGWAGPMPAVGGAPPVRPPIPIEPVCQGVPADWCREMAMSAWESSPGGAGVLSIVIRCTTTCDATHGDGDAVVTYANGTAEQSSWGYDGG